MSRRAAGSDESAELRRLREAIDALDRQIVDLLNQRANLAVAVAHEKSALGRKAIRDAGREREVLLRVSIANGGPLPQADLLAIYRRLIASLRSLEASERERRRRDEDGPGEPPGA